MFCCMHFLCDLVQTCKLGMDHHGIQRLTKLAQKALNLLRFSSSASYSSTHAERIGATALISKLIAVLHVLHAWSRFSSQHPTMFGVVDRVLDCGEVCCLHFNQPSAKPASTSLQRELCTVIPAKIQSDQLHCQRADQSLLTISPDAIQCQSATDVTRLQQRRSQPEPAWPCMNQSASASLNSGTGVNTYGR